MFASTKRVLFVCMNLGTLDAMDEVCNWSQFKCPGLTHTRQAVSDESSLND